MLFAKVPLHFSESLPINRAFTRLEAAFHYDMDRLMSKKRSKLEYSKVWAWDRRKVDRFIDEIDSKTDEDSLSIPIKNGAQKRHNITTTNAHIKQQKNNTLQEQKHNNSTVYAQETNTLFIEEREREQHSVLYDLWNEIVKGTPLSPARSLSEDRLKKCNTRLNERSAQEWEEVFRLMTASPFMCGGGNKGWKASFDWIIKNSDNAGKVLEGNYQSAGGRAVSNDTRYAAIFAGA